MYPEIKPKFKQIKFFQISNLTRKNTTSASYGTNYCSLRFHAHTTVTFAPLLILENINETGKIRGSLNTDTFDSDTLYGLKLYAMTPNGFAEIKNVDPIYFRKSSSSVDEIMSRNEMSVRYDAAKGVVIAEGDVECLGIYDINGNLISSDSVQNDGKTIVNLNVLGKGVVLAVARFKSGKVKALKIIL